MKLNGRIGPWIFLYVFLKHRNLGSKVVKLVPGFALYVFMKYGDRTGPWIFLYVFMSRGGGGRLTARLRLCKLAGQWTPVTDHKIFAGRGEDPSF